MLMRLCQSRVFAMDPSRGGRRVCHMTRETMRPRKTMAPMIAPISAPSGMELLEAAVDDVEEAAEAEDWRIDLDGEEIGTVGFEMPVRASEAFGAAVSMASVSV